MRVTILVAAVLALAAATAAQVKQPPAEYECRFTDLPVTIDGKADEAAWKHAQIIDHFYLPWLGDKARAARTATRARLLWDREHLYFFADMDDTDVYADETKHDGVTWDNDVFELFFKPADDKAGYYEFQVNAANTKLDAFFPRRAAGGVRRFAGDGEFHIESKVAVHGTLNNWRDKDQGWSVEGRIPWTDFFRTGGRPAVDERWKFTLCRYDYSVDFEGPELSVCAPMKSLDRPNFHYHEDYMPLRFVGIAAQEGKPLGLPKRVPVTTSRVAGFPDPLPPYRALRIYPNLKLQYPILTIKQPVSDHLLILSQTSPWQKTSIVRVKDSPDASETETLLTLDGGITDLVFHPKFKDNGYLYLGWNGLLSAKSADRKSRITRYTMQTSPPYKLDPDSAKEIIAWPSDGHNGAAIAFGLDGMLYITSGDGTSDSDTNLMGQRMDTLLAKVLRIDVDRPDAGKTYSVPKDNPFVGREGIRPETWAYGLRNPWRMTTDAKTGHIWVGNNGQDLWEQAYLVNKGDNFGWSVMEGSHPFYLNRTAGPTPFVKPTVEHHHSEARSLTGGVVYYGEKLPELRGAYLYGDYSTGRIWAVKHDGKKVQWHKEIARTTLRITGFGLDKAGELIICDHQPANDSGLYTLEKQAPDAQANARFPRRLSESGLFASVKGHVMAPGLIPYDVNAPLWSDGAHKERYLALPGHETIGFTRWRAWQFPDETVLVKSFALDTIEGKPDSRRYIETRFLAKHKGEWFGYSYRWNDEQTDADLVESGGADATYRIAVPKSAANPGGVRDLPWRYPSRAECMVCHSRAANFVLGLTEAQMNRDFDYGGVRDNQLRMLEAIGVLRANWSGDTQGQLRDDLKKDGKSDKDIDDLIRTMTATRDQRAPRESTLLHAAPDRLRRLADPYDDKADLTARARAYLQANCAHCHVEAGGGNAQMELEHTVDLSKMRIIDVVPLHHTFGLLDARLVAPGDPARSILLHRVSTRQAGHMPPLATSIVDEKAAAMLKRWIEQVKP